MAPPAPPPDLHNRRTLRAYVRGRIVELLGRQPATIYEAGGGSATILGELVEGAHVVVVDISPDQVAKCTYADEAIEGNIETWRRPEAFDLVCCHNVLEHVGAAARAVESLAASVAPGGVCVVAGPVPTSVKGWTTRLTPYRFHVWFYRRVRGSKTAGLPGHAPFPTRFSPGSHPAALRRLLTAHGLEVADQMRFEGMQSRGLANSSRWLNGLYAGVCGLLAAASFGRYRPRLSEFLLIARRPRPEATG